MTSTTRQGTAYKRPGREMSESDAAPAQQAQQTELLHAESA